MISISNKSLNNFKLTLTFLIVAWLFPLGVSAQISQSLSVSPTLFEMTANPGQEWSSGIRVINPNPFEIVVYADPVNFAPKGEGGQATFIPIIKDESEGTTIAEWIDVERTEIVIPPETTEQIPFIIRVPENAPPGGHFASLLIGTKPPEVEGEKPLVQTSQVVTSLIFLRVTGDVIEKGDIRSFRTSKSFLDKPEVDFELRFQNTGNVHILPQGEIKIVNMWGQERGVIPVNRDTLFGNVLPDSVRNYRFSWSGEWSLADMGRYTAVATLGYGYEQKQFASLETSFWVVPWKGALITLLSVVGFFVFMTWSIKLYIRRMLAMAGVSSPSGQSYSTPIRKVSVTAPIEAGMLDLRDRLDTADGFASKLKTYTSFVLNYKFFFIGVLALVAFVWAIVWYVSSASVDSRSYEVKIGEAEVEYSSEDLEYEKLSNENVVVVEVDESLPTIDIVNRSGVRGLAAGLRVNLESVGYEVVDVSNDLGVSEENTVIVYPPDLAEDALKLSQNIPDSLLSSFEGDTGSLAQITVYVGKNYNPDVQ